MKKASIKPRRLYAVMGADRVVAPSLVLDNALWDRLPEAGEIAYRPAPEDARWSMTIDRDTGARRGIPAVLPRPGTELTDDVLEVLERLARRKATRLSVPDAGSRAISAWADLIEAPLILDVVRDSKILMPWVTYVSGEKLYVCSACGSSVSLNAASRLRAHPDRTGASCRRSNTPLSEEERRAEEEAV